jgi:hypothetical protein
MYEGPHRVLVHLAARGLNFLNYSRRLAYVAAHLITNPVGHGGR